MALIRCAACRYSFEHAGDEPPTTCPQCGGSLRSRDARPPDDRRKERPTQRMPTIPKPED